MKTGLLYLSVLLIFSLCFYRMNLHFSRLSRYPYEDQKAREIIDRYLSDEDIEYIIEYAIALEEFIDYVPSPYFNMYHAPLYKKLQEVRWDEDPMSIVYEVETLLSLTDDIDEAIARMASHSFEEVMASYEASK